MHPREKFKSPSVIVARMYLLNKVKWYSLNRSATELYNADLWISKNNNCHTKYIYMQISQHLLTNIPVV